MFRGLIGVFAMYSKVPMPTLAWDEKCKRYIICFLPIVGLVLGAFYVLVFNLCEYMMWDGFLKGVLLAAVPIAFTGGIHFDGFIDTVDAISSYASKEKRLEILKDPHVGAFGIIWSIVYFSMFAGFSSCIDNGSILAMGGIFIISRCISATACVSIENANKNGSLHTLTKGTNKIVLIGVVITSIALYLLFVEGLFILKGIVLLGTVCYFFIFKRFAIKNFGGITGDLAGFLLQTSELLMLVLIVSMGRFW